MPVTMNPASHDAHNLAPFTKHPAPVWPTPFAHVHTFSAHHRELVRMLCVNRQFTTNVRTYEYIRFCPG